MKSTASPDETLMTLASWFSVKEHACSMGKNSFSNNAHGNKIHLNPPPHIMYKKKNPSRLMRDVEAKSHKTLRSKTLLSNVDKEDQFFLNMQKID